VRRYRMQLLWLRVSGLLLAYPMVLDLDANRWFLIGDMSQR
jgi:hypothetical protein